MVRYSSFNSQHLTLIQEAAESFAATVSFDEFQDLKELMVADGAPEVPVNAAAIPELALVRNLPTLAPCAAYSVREGQNNTHY